MSNGGGDHGRNVHAASMARARVNARLRHEWWLREQERRKSESARPLPKEERPPTISGLRRVLKLLRLG